MSDLQRRLQEFWAGLDESVNPVELDEAFRERIGEGPVQPLVDRMPWRSRGRPAWVVAAAGLVTVLFVGTVTWQLLPGGEDKPAVGEGPIAMTPIPAEPHAGGTASVATCPPGTNPGSPGPADQERPGQGSWSNQAAVFDQHNGWILYVDETGETWTFDVCANTWLRMNPEKDKPIGGELVFDVDSDRTISIRPDIVAVYDAATNAWTHRSQPPGFASGDLGAVYDPVSGLVVAQTESGLVTYDVDTDTWSAIGGFDSELYPPFLVGYITEIDRLSFLRFNAAPNQGAGVLVDPRSGGAAFLDGPAGGVAGGFGSFKYATGGETAYVFSEGVCRLEPGSLEWDCIPLPDGYETQQIPAALVFDSINNRLVLINDWCCNWPGRATSDDIWAVDFQTREWTQLLAPDAFDFAEDDLCEWIEAEHVSNIVADAYGLYDISPVNTDFEQSWDSDSYLGCAWSVGDPGQAGSYSEVGLIRADLRSDDTEGSFEPHPALSAGVQVGPGVDYVGAFGDWIPGMEVRIQIEGQEYTVEFWHGVLPGFDGDANTILTIADGLLRAMGWVPVQGS